MPPKRSINRTSVKHEKTETITVVLKRVNSTVRLSMTLSNGLWIFTNSIAFATGGHYHQTDRKEFYKIREADVYADAKELELVKAGFKRIATEYS